MNNKQKLFCAVSGYSYGGKMAGAKDTYYYDSNEKLEYLKECCKEVIDVDLSDAEILEVKNLLDADFDNRNDLYQSVDAL